jgi:hypothetical protein
MIRYVAAAVALKIFSCCSPARNVYRMLGNLVGGKGRMDAPLPSFYMDRIRWKADLCKKYGILKDGDLILELGTGWVHWEAITLSLFWDIRAVLYDVWDNRQFGALKSFVGKLQAAFEKDFSVEGVDMQRARQMIRKLSAVGSFDELYGLLGFRYVVDPTGTLEFLKNEPFQLVVSAGVFEHIHREGLPSFIGRWARLMTPGAYAVHSINIRDHLMQYDPSVSPKQYLAYPETLWKMLFQNDVQYINRVQRREWLEMFSKAGLQVLEENGTYVDLNRLRINERYATMDPRDLSCAQLEVVLRKPEASLSFVNPPGVTM